MAYRVVRSIELRAAPAEVWPYLTDPELLAEWFAGTETFAPGEPFRFDFGDGDFFAGRVLGFDPPSRLVLHWKFMAVGPLFEIVYTLEASENGTRLTVQDTGSLSSEEATGLNEGWADFLGRLQGRIETGQPSRYLWNQTIGAGALIEDADASRLADPAWLCDAFGVTPRVERSGSDVVLTFGSPGWDGKTTQATISVHKVEGRTYVGVVHSGWTDLPETLRIDERRRFANVWAAALAGVEQSGRVSPA